MDDPARFEIRVAEHLTERLALYLGRLEMHHAARGGETVLVCEVADQPALFGVLTRIRDLGLTLVSLRRMEDVPLSTNISPSGVILPDSGGGAV